MVSPSSSFADVPIIDYASAVTIIWSSFAFFKFSISKSGWFDVSTLI
jgi:hypothetical protein